MRHESRDARSAHGAKSSLRSADAMPDVGTEVVHPTQTETGAIEVIDLYRIPAAQTYRRSDVRRLFP